MKQKLLYCIGATQSATADKLVRRLEQEKLLADPNLLIVDIHAPLAEPADSGQVKSAVKRWQFVLQPVKLQCFLKTIATTICSFNYYCRSRK